MRWKIDAVKYEGENVVLCASAPIGDGTYGKSMEVAIERRLLLDLLWSLGVGSGGMSPPESP